MCVGNIMHAIRHPVKAYHESIAKEHVIHRKNGEEPQSTYYVIRCNLPECGFFAIYTYVIDHLAIAVDKGYIPVLDMEPYPCLYKEEKPICGTCNPWLYYFEPWNSISTKSLKTKANVVLAPIKFPHYKAIYYYRDREQNVMPPKQRIAELYKLVNEYIRFTPEVQQMLEEKVKVLKGRGKIVGIHVRGTDMYTEGKQHPIPTGKTKNFIVIDKILERHQADSIFLCTDTQSTLETFKKQYGKRVITMDAVRQKNDQATGVHKDQSLAQGRVHHKYQMGLEVLTDMYLLSRCDVLVCGPSNVPFIAVVYNNNRYEKVYYYA